MYMSVASFPMVQCCIKRMNYILLKLKKLEFSKLINVFFKTQYKKINLKFNAHPPPPFH